MLTVGSGAMTASKTEVSVTRHGERSYQVEVRGRGVTTIHTVDVPEGLATELGWHDAPESELVRESFAFLLEREPPTSIMRSFSLDVIGRYFPEYRTEIRRRVGA
jgi:hypothetical protein